MASKEKGAEAAPKAKSKRKTDKFGFQVGSKSAQVAAQYAGKGATQAEVKKKFGRTFHNVLSIAKTRGHAVSTKVEKNGNRTRKRYFLKPKKVA